MFYLTPHTFFVIRFLPMWLVIFGFYYRYFRFCIKRILNHLIQADFQCGPKRVLGSDTKRKGEKKERGADSEITKECQSSRTVEEELQEKKDIAKEHLVTNNRNWGKMSPMMLAAKTHDRDIIAHDLCWKVICKVWRNGTLRKQADIFADFYRYCSSQLCICI